MLKNSADSFVGNETCGDVHLCVLIEVVTMVLLSTIYKSKSIRKRHEALSKVTSITISKDSEKHFKMLLFANAYRFQCIHHAGVMELSQVIFVVAKGDW